MRAIAFAALLLALAPASAGQATVPDSLARARQLTEWFFGGQLDSVLANSQPDDRSEANALEELRQRLDFLQERGGGELDVVEERFVRRGGRTQYWRTAWWSNFQEETITFRLVIIDGMVAGMGVNPTSQNPPIDP